MISSWRLYEEEEYGNIDLAFVRRLGWVGNGIIWRYGKGNRTEGIGSKESKLLAATDGVSNMVFLSYYCKIDMRMQQDGDIQI
jgi:hypothetical protein